MTAPIELNHQRKEKQIPILGPYSKEEIGLLVANVRRALASPSFPGGCVFPTHIEITEEPNDLFHMPAIGFKVEEAMSEQMRLQYMEKFSNIVDRRVPVIIEWLTKDEHGNQTQIEKRIYLREFPALGFITLRDFQRLLHLKNASEKQEFMGDTKLLKREKFVKWLIEKGKLSDYPKNDQSSAGNKTSPVD